LPARQIARQQKQRSPPAGLDFSEKPREVRQYTRTSGNRNRKQSAIGKIATGLPAQIDLYLFT